MKSSSLKKELRALASPERAKISSWFFKTDVGQYGHGDIFIGVTTPDVRSIVKKYRGIELLEIEKLLHSKEHEFRLAALLLLVDAYKTADDTEEIYNLYLANTKWINNWDLVDTSAHYIVGAYLEKKNKNTLMHLAKSDSLWERRIAMIATFYYIKQGKSKNAFIVAKILLHDKHDLIQKAVGWMLREVGKRCSERELTDFLDKYYKTMPRTALRYAIERLSPEQKKKYILKSAN